MAHRSSMRRLTANIMREAEQYQTDPGPEPEPTLKQAPAPLGTLPHRYNAAVTELLEAGDAEAATDLMLRAMPFIEEYYGADDATPAPSTGKLDAIVEAEVGSSRLSVLHRYMDEVEGSGHGWSARQTAADTGNEFTCAACNVPKILDKPNASLVCPRCGVTSPFMAMDQSNMSFDDQMTCEFSSHCAYKRSNHFSELLNSLQGRESTVIPQHILDAVRAEFKKMRINTRSEITPDRVRDFLKKLRLNKWYEHKHAICNALNGTPAPTLSPSLEATLKQMFVKIQKPFDQNYKKVAPDRKNFLSYSYVFHKFFQMLGEAELAQHFALLKSTHKLYQMDAIWRLICDDLGWKFVPSV